MSSANAAITDKSPAASDEQKDSTNNPPTSTLATEVKAGEVPTTEPTKSDVATSKTKSPSPKRGSEHKVRFTEEEAPPTKPARPQSPQERALAILIEAFPSIDTKVVKAVLHASGGQLEPAFNALLGMSDPDFQDDSPPPPPPRPTTEQQQLHNDELYARQLADHYSSTERSRTRPNATTRRSDPTSQTTRPAGDNERDYSFFDDELPVIQQNIKQGFLQTQTKVNKWISDFRKRIDGEDDDAHATDPLYADPTETQTRPNPQRENFGSSQAEQLRGIQRMASQRERERQRSATRYDADPQVIGNDFSRLALQDNDAIPPAKPARPLANPDLFRSGNSTGTPRPPQAGPVDEVDAMVGRPLEGAASPGGRIEMGGTPGGKSKKWQPLTSVAPAPDVKGDEAGGDDEEDPFSLGDSDGEAVDKKEDLLKESSERLKKAAADKGKGRKMSLEAKEEGTGTRDKEAEAILKGKS